MKRDKHTLSFYRMITCDMGELVPIGCVPVLPGDTFQHSTSALIRVSPLNTPVMHPVSVRIHHFFVPNRIIWDGWEEFITGGDGQSVPDSIPTMTTTGEPRTMTAYLGVPPIAGVEINELPKIAVNRIINEYYRDQDLEPLRPDNNNSPFKVAWEKDYFTTCRPWAQKGPDITLPIAGTADVFHAAAGGQEQVTVRQGDGPDWVRLLGTPNVTTGPGDNDLEDRLQVDMATASQINVNDFRAGFALQRYQEARARYGSRFTEYLRYLGVTPSDARLQRPEFLGGGTSRLNFSEVLQTTPGAEGEDGVGDLFGHGIAGVRSNAYRKFFEEHGYVISLLSVRPKAIYMNGLHREFLKTTKEDYFQRELANLGQQEVYQAELYSENEREVFGFQDRYHEYRSHPSQVSQDFRDTLNAWHLARELDADVTLNEDFIDCDPSRRIFQITDDSVNTLWCMVNHSLVARRLVPKRAFPRIL